MPPLLLIAFLVLGALPRPALAGTTILCTLVVEATTGAAVIDEGDCATRWSPASTFKVALALMGFDAGILTAPDAPEVPFREGYVDWRPEWRRPTTPQSWMRDSVVWYSQWLTPQLGLARLQAYVDAFDYGNRDLAGDPGKDDGLTRAWLGSSLAISPAEQVALLRRLVARDLPVSPTAMDDTVAIMDYGTGDGGWRVHGKTGATAPRLANGTTDRDNPIGWFVGWADRNGRTLVFARLVQESTPPEVPPSYRARDSVLTGVFGPGGPLD